MHSDWPPVIRELDRDEIEAILRRNHVGRIAYAGEDGVDLEPIHYVYADGTLFGRTSPGTKLRAVWKDPRVAFEVDEIEALFDWRSVVVRGLFHRIPGDASEDRSALYDRAVELLRTLVPATLTTDDPFPGRSVLFRIRIQEWVGRASSASAERRVE